jgi:phage tail sheath protein FI
MPDIVYPTFHIEDLVGPQPVENLSTSITVFVGTTRRGPTNKPTTVTGIAEFEQSFGKLSAFHEMAYAIRSFFENGGQQAIVVRVARGKGVPHPDDIIGSKQNMTGLYALDKLDRFNLLCLPPVQSGGDTAWPVYQAALSYCAQRRAMLIVDVPASWTPLESADVNGIIAAFAQSPLFSMESRDNAILYFPRIVQANPLQNGTARMTVACGAVAGVISRTDRERGIWKAPAGAESELRGIVKLPVELNDGQNADLNQAGINCLRQFTGKHVIWGARTLSTKPEWKYIPVRRLALFLENSIIDGMTWARFELNAEPLWAKLRATIGDFLHALFQQGAFQGTTPKDAYFVKCGPDTMTQADLTAGRLNIMVGFAPIKPAEFVVIRIQTLAMGSA